MTTSTRPNGQLAAILRVQHKKVLHYSSDSTLKETNAYHLGQFVQQLINLLAVGKADVRLAHQAPHFLPDVIFVHLRRHSQEN